MFFVIFVIFVVALSTPAAAQTFDPKYRFRVLSTDHFDIYFHQGEDALAERLAPIAEETWRRFQDSLGRSASGRTHVILVDQADLANGWATPLPRNTIALFAAWPAGSESLETDDWLRLVFTHEFTHILHLDRSNGWARVVRRVFGRTPLAFPNLLLPIWQVEGLAVYEESALTGRGRMYAGDFRALVDEAARAQQPLSLDRVNGGLTRWPGGQAPYAYGLRFHAFLAERYGADTLTTLADRTAGAWPFLGSLAFKRVYGKSLGVLWREFQDSLAPGVGTETASQDGTRLTHHDYAVLGPRVVPAACTACPPDIYYSVRNADNLPALYRMRLSSGAPSDPERVTTRFLGATIGVGRERLYFDQQEIRRNAGLYSDLYSLDPKTRRVRRLTREARLLDPDLSSDERTIAAVQLRPGGRDLVLVRLASADVVSSMAPLASEPETQFNAPRWSPDGRTIVVERHRLNQLPEIVVVDAATGGVRAIASDPQTRWATPTWRPDGQAIIAAAAIGDATFNLYEIDLAGSGVRQITRTTGGATWPEVAPDGTSIFYVGYTATGFDLYEMPYPALPDGAPDLQVRGPERTSEIETPLQSPPGLKARGSSDQAYSPFPTLAPTWWSPIWVGSDEQSGVGAATAGSDVLGYHAYAASVTKWTDRRENAPPGLPSIDWNVSYAYSRWRPAFFGAASRETTFFRDAVDSSDEEQEFTRQETRLEVGVAVPVAHVRSSQMALVSFQRGQSLVFTDSGRHSLERAAGRLAWSFKTAHVFANSISPERGVASGFTTELVRRSWGSSADATTVTADARLYAPGLGSHHVLALRVAAGQTTGDRLVGRTFRLGGPGSDLSLIDFGSRAISVLRGFGTDTFGGSHIAVLNADYRFPLVRIERGLGTWPFFVHTIHAAVFADAGHAWTRAFTAADLKRSIGAELSANLVLGYWAPVTIAAGAARGHDGSHRVPDATTWYGRLGFAF